MSNSENSSLVKMPMSSIVGNARLEQMLIEWFRHVFNSSGSHDWNLAWSDERIASFLFDKNVDDITVYMQFSNERQISAASAYAIGKINEVYLEGDAPYDHISKHHAEVIKSLTKHMGDGANVIYFHFLGVIPKKRGDLHLVTDLIRIPVTKSGADFTVCRTSMNSSLYGILAVFTPEYEYSFNDEQQTVVLAASCDKMLSVLSLSHRDFKRKMVKCIRDKGP